MSGWYEQAKGYSIETIASSLGLKKKSGRWGPCPACHAADLGEISKKQAARSPIRFYRSGETELWECIACQVWGNMFDLVAYEKENKPAEQCLTTYYDKKAKVIRNDWSILRNHFQELKICVYTAEKLAKEKTYQKYPPVKEVEHLLKSSIPFPKCEYERIKNWCKKRGLDKEKVQAGFANPKFDCNQLTHIQWNDRNIPWFPSGWKSKFPVLIPMVDHKGNLRSVMGRSTEKAKRKSTCPIGYSTANLFFANKNARLFMKREHRPEKIWICEGEVDYLTLSQLDQLTVIGVRSGSISHLQLMPWHICQTVYIATDNDKQGDEYANQISRIVFPAEARRVDVRKLNGGGMI